MKNKEIHVLLTRTINLGDFENIKIEIGVTTDIDSDENIIEAIAELSSNLFQELKIESKTYKKELKHKQKPQRDY